MPRGTRISVVFVVATSLLTGGCVTDSAKHVARAPAESSAAFDETTSPDVLRHHVLTDPDTESRLRALKLLRIRMPAPGYLAFCDRVMEIEVPEGQLHWWGEVAYQRHLADPNAPVKQPLLAESVRLARECRYAGTADGRAGVHVL